MHDDRVLQVDGRAGLGEQPAVIAVNSASQVGSASTLKRPSRPIAVIRRLSTCVAELAPIVSRDRNSEEWRLAK